MVRGTGGPRTGSLTTKGSTYKRPQLERVAIALLFQIRQLQ